MSDTVRDLLAVIGFLSIGLSAFVVLVFLALPALKAWWANRPRLSWRVRA